MLIALHSRGHRAGKDTAARFIQEWCFTHGQSYQRRAFAEKMKRLVALALDHGAAQEGDWDAAAALVDELKIRGAVGWTLADKIDIDRCQTGRDFIINLAEGARRLFGTDFWLDQALPVSWCPEADVTVITDLRFPEEALRVREHKGIVVEVVNPRAQDPGGRSEQGLASGLIDQRLYNTGDLGMLEYRVRRLMELCCGVQT